MDRDQIIAKLREYAPELKAAGMEHLVLHGSYARGTAIRGVLRCGYHRRVRAWTPPVPCGHGRHPEPSDGTTGCPCRSVARQNTEETICSASAQQAPARPPVTAARSAYRRLE